MVIYADILMLVNLIVDYFLILLCGVFLKQQPPFWRILLGAVAGAVSSLYIFLPRLNTFFDMLANLFFSAIITLIAFGFHSIKYYIRTVFSFFVISFSYAGAMLAVWTIFRPHGLIIHNSVVYYDISPTFLILFSVIGYFISAGVGILLRKKGQSATRCNVCMILGEKSVRSDGLLDSGNSLYDAFGLSQVIIVNRSTVTELFGDNLNTDFCQSRYRTLPCSTVSDTTLLDGYRIDSAEITVAPKTVLLKKPILAISKTALVDCGALVNPNILEGV